MVQNVRALLEQHEATLLARLRSFRDQIIPLERELAEVRRAKQSLTLADYGPEQVPLAFPKHGEEMPSSANSEQVGLYGTNEGGAGSPYANVTIKNLVRKALSEQFDRGATANELLHFFRDAWGRSDVVRTSLSPQLSRLKVAGEIILVGQRWVLRPGAHQPDTDILELPEKAAAGL